MMWFVFNFDEVLALLTLCMELLESLISFVFMTFRSGQLADLVDLDM